MNELRRTGSAGCSKTVPRPTGSLTWAVGCGGDVGGDGRDVLTAVVGEGREVPVAAVVVIVLVPRGVSRYPAAPPARASARPAATRAGTRGRRGGAPGRLPGAAPDRAPGGTPGGVASGAPG